MKTFLIFTAIFILFLLSFFFEKNLFYFLVSVFVILSLLGGLSLFNSFDHKWKKNAVRASNYTQTGSETAKYNALVNEHNNLKKQFNTLEYRSKNDFCDAELITINQNLKDRIKQLELDNTSLKEKAELSRSNREKKNQSRIFELKNNLKRLSTDNKNEYNRLKDKYNQLELTFEKEFQIKLKAELSKKKIDNKLRTEIDQLKVELNKVKLEKQALFVKNDNMSKKLNKQSGIIRDLNQIISDVTNKSVDIDLNENAMHE